MKAQEIRRNMERNFIWISAVLALIGLLGLASISLAVEDTWIQKADMPTPRRAFSSSVVDGKIYVFGGAPWGGARKAEATASTEEYDPATDTWTTKADMPTARWGSSASVVNGKIYVFGGTVGGTERVFSTVEEYDPATDTWKTKADMPTARWSLSTSVVNGKIYAIGGDPKGQSNTSTVEEYDPAADTWTTRADMPTSRFGLSTSAVDGKIYAFGGAPNFTQPAFSTVEEYDPATDTWTTKAHMPTARLYFPTGAVNGRIYAIGGTGQATWAGLQTVEEYDPATDTWTAKAHMPTERRGHSASVARGKIYAIGGMRRWPPVASLSTVEEYDTGFVPLITSVDSSIISVEATGKLTTTWGKIR